MVGLKKIGKRGKEWQRARAKLIEEALLNGRLTLVSGVLWGSCEDCGRWMPLTPDHCLKRSQGGLHDKSNIDWVCVQCHDLRDNMGDPKKKKPKSKKADWEKPHQCRKCGVVVSMFICPRCGSKSI